MTVLNSPARKRLIEQVLSATSLAEAEAQETGRAAPALTGHAA